MLNTIQISGRLVRDPELRYTASQTPVLSICVAVDRDFADRETGKRDVDYIDCVAWRSTATFVNNYFHKGEMITLTGRLQIREWTDNDGHKRRNAEVLIEHAYFAQTRAQQYDNNGGGELTPIDDDGELPFD